MFLSAAMMLRHGLGRPDEAAALESAVDRALDDGLRTPDLGGDATHGRGDRGRPVPPAKEPTHVEPVDLIWMNGEFVAWDDAKVHVLTHGLHYGTGVFEGIRCYETEQGPAIFRHHDHLERLYKSAELYYMPIPFELEELRQATHELIARNGLQSCYIRPLAFRGYGPDGPVTRSTRRSTCRSPCGRGARTSARRASAWACAPRSPRGGASAPTR